MLGIPAVLSLTEQQVFKGRLHMADWVSQPRYQLTIKPSWVVTQTIHD